MPVAPVTRRRHSPSTVPPTRRRCEAYRRRGEPPGDAEWRAGVGVGGGIGLGVALVRSAGCPPLCGAGIRRTSSRRRGADEGLIAGGGNPGGTWGGGGGGGIGLGVALVRFAGCPPLCGAGIRRTSSRRRGADEGPSQAGRTTGRRR